MSDQSVANTEQEILRQVILQAGALAKDFFRRSGKLQADKKGPKDLVTEADILVERFIRAQFAEKFPDYGFIGEESGTSADLSSCWIVDPIDGTHSFYRGQYFWSVSIALQKAGKIVRGAVFAPALDDLYLAEKGQGASKNGQIIRCSSVSAMDEAMVCTGFACLRANLESNNLDRFARVALKTRDQRRYGSAALDLCLVADGQLDAFWEQNLNLYDVAAGCLIAEEAGAKITDFSGKAGINPREVLVTNGSLHQGLLELM